MKAFYVLEEELDDKMLTSTVKELSLSVKDNAELLLDTFCMKNVVEQFSVEQVLTFSNLLLKNDSSKMMRIAYNNDRILNGLLYSLLTNLIRTIKVKKGTLKASNLINVITAESFLDANGFNNIQEVATTFQELAKQDHELLSFKCKETKALEYVAAIKALPLIHMTKYVRTITFFYFYCLLSDLRASNVEMLVKEVESILIGLVQNGQLTFPKELKPSVLVIFTLNHVENYEIILQHIVNGLFKDEETSINFKSAINYLCKNIEEDKRLRLAFVVLNEIAKVYFLKAVNFTFKSRFFLLV